MSENNTNRSQWKNATFIDYMNACDDYASRQYLIDSSDLGIDEKMMANAQEALESPKTLVDSCAKKYDLTPYMRSQNGNHATLKQQRKMNVELTNINREMLLTLKAVKKDFGMLLSGEWDGSEEGIKAWLDTLRTVISKAERQQRQNTRGQEIGM